MDYTTRNTQPKATPRQNVPVQPIPMAAPQAPRGSRRMKIIAIIVTVMIILIVAAVGYKYYAKDSQTDLVGVKSGSYQALFLTNGQVYFGKLEKADRETIKLTDIFYLQVQQPVQPAESDQKQGETQLIKLGEELHGHEDAMYIDRDQVSFWENIKDNGKVAEAIKQYKK